MPTCPNCGEIVMNGDPYCPNCGTIFQSRYKEEDDRADDFKSLLNSARDNYNAHDYEKAFIFLDFASQVYKKMNRHEKSRVRAEPFSQDWIVELCCRTFNNHGRCQREATDFIIEHNYEVRVCMDCDCIYPKNYKFCIRCGKPLTRPTGKSPEKIADELTELLSKRIYDEFEITKLSAGQ